jgi:hypothetical protein
MGRRQARAQQAEQLQQQQQQLAVHVAGVEPRFAWLLEGGSIDTFLGAVAGLYDLSGSSLLFFSLFTPPAGSWPLITPSCRYGTCRDRTRGGVSKGPLGVEVC